MDLEWNEVIKSLKATICDKGLKYLITKHIENFSLQNDNG